MTSSPVPQKTVLVASDTASVRERFKAALGAAGHRAMVAKSVAEVLGRVRADLAELDLIVLDLRLARTSGVELVKSIRKIDGRRLPILVFSGSVSTAEEVRELGGLGVSGYLNEYGAVEHILPSIAPHLFPDNINRRGGPRVVMGLAVSYRMGVTTAAALSLNLSRGGIAIRTSSPHPSDTVLSVRFRLPGSRSDINAATVVAWSSGKAGMGLRFTEVAPGDQAAIDEFVDAHFFRPPTT